MEDLKRYEVSQHWIWRNRETGEIAPIHNAPRSYEDDPAWSCNTDGWQLKNPYTGRYLPNAEPLTHEEAEEFAKTHLPPRIVEA
jgi:hypothetical protein